MTTYIAYYRVSTQRQGHSGLGLDSQRELIRRYLRHDDIILAEYTEIESGKDLSNRPTLRQALSQCASTGATLIVAKLDRLSRSIAFVTSLMESKVKFVIADMPEANNLTIHIIAACAQYEREQISKRTKAALQAAKARGQVLGNPNLHLARAIANKTRQVHELPPPAIIALILEKKKNLSLRKVAEHLNALDIRTVRGCKWCGTSIKRIIERVKNV